MLRKIKIVEFFPKKAVSIQHRDGFFVENGLNTEGAIFL